MALQLHFNGVTSLQCVHHIRCIFPSSTTSTKGTSFGGLTTNPCRGSFLLPKHGTDSPVKQRRPLLAVQCATTTPKKFSVPKYDEDELPPFLASLEVEGLPPCQGSVYEDESLARILTMGPSDLLGDCYAACNSFTSFVHCGAVSAERLAASAAVGTWITFLDDILFDEQDASLLEKLGIDPTILASPERIWQYICALDALLLQEERPASPTKIEDMAWKIGRDLRALSSPNLEWFNLCIDAVVDFHTANYESYCDSLRADRTKCLPDLATYMAMRSRTLPGKFSTISIHFIQNSYLPSEIREHPVLQKLNELTITYVGYIQDIFSYSKELAETVSTNNLLDVLMAGEPGMTLPRAAWKAVNMTRAVAQEFLELEATQLPSWEEPWASAVRLYVEGLKETMSGFLYWHSKTRRYRHPDAPFPELRDVNVSFLPKPDSLKVVSRE